MYQVLIGTQQKHKEQKMLHARDINHEVNWASIGYLYRLDIHIEVVYGYMHVDVRMDTKKHFGECTLH